MKADFEPHEIEQNAQRAWAAANVYRVAEDPSRPKFYACSMLPYPSGRLHMGHVRNYTINDMLARQLRMAGMNVLMPMGWDAFGLPAENAAMKNGVPPARWTRDNIAAMKAQMQALGLAFDWSREVATCDPAYYKWNQWFFLKMLEAGIAERRTQVVNWDPVDQTVLANEQVIEGRGWRSGALVEKREIPGYYLKITQYADELLECVQTGLPGWPERVKLMQEHWLGKSEGVRFAFLHDVRDGAGALIGGGRLWVFTTRADTIMGVTFCAVAPEHPLALRAAEKNPAVAAFLESCKTGGTTEAEMATLAKRGIDTGLVVEHPLSHEQIPLWVGNYVLMHYGDGAVMGVPAHDERDFAFARQYGIDMLQVVHVDGEEFSYEAWQDWYADTTCGVTINSDVYSGLSYEVAVDAVAAALEHRGLGGKQMTWRLRDWGISRQRYWGTPIPIIHCEVCGVVPVPEKDLPVVLPEDLIPDGSGNPLAKHGAFLNVACPTCGRAARRETDTMDTFVDSAWYYMRYCDPHLEGAMVGAGTKYWMPMDQYIGGIEHAILHLLYARFWTKVMRDMKLVAIDEPFTQAADAGHGAQPRLGAHVRAGRRRLLPARRGHARRRGRGPAEQRPAGRRQRGRVPRHAEDGQDRAQRRRPAGSDRPLRRRHGAPVRHVRGAARAVARLEQRRRRGREPLPQAPVEVRRHGTPTTIDSAPGRQPARGGAPALRHEIHSVLRQVSYDYERMQYNTVVSGAMKLLNALETHAGQGTVAPAPLREGFGILLRVLYPVCPHTTWTLWNELGFAADHRPPARRALAADRRERAGAGRDRADAADQRQAARLDSRRRQGRQGAHRSGRAGDAGVREVRRGSARRRRSIVVPGRLVNVVV